MKILITGGGGYKGLKLAKILLENGHEVTLFDNFLYGQDPCLFLFDYPALKIVCKDIRNIEKSDLVDYDCIYHLAGISGYAPCEANPHSAHLINVEATRKFVSLLSPSQLLGYASTTSFYGKEGKVCTEDSTIQAVSLYGISKYEAEKICMERENSTAFRFATIFGVSPRMRWDLMPNEFVMRAVQERSLVLFDPNSVRTFLHIDDAIKAYLMLLDKTDDMTGQVFNVGCEAMNLSKMQLAQKIKQHVDFEIIEVTSHDLDSRSFIVNFDQISVLGFKASKDLDEGIQELVKLFSFYQPSRPYNVI